MNLKLVKKHEDAKLPVKAHSTDAGFDLFAVTKTIDKDNRQITYGTGVAIEIPEGKVGLIFPRSSVRKTDLSLSNCTGVIDAKFQGEIMATFTMLNEDSLKKKTHYQVGDRIAQLVVIDLSDISGFDVVESFDTISERGEGAYGSTGLTEEDLNNIQEEGEE